MKPFLTAIKRRTNDKILRGRTLFPSHESELAEIMALANKYQMPIYTEDVDSDEGFTISLDKMDKIIEISEEDFLLLAEAGATVNECRETVLSRNLFFPLESSDMSLLEAINTPITPDFKYYVLGVRMIAASGEVLRFGGRTVKNVTGYNIGGFLSGAKGIFGIVTQLTIKLTPLPKYDYQPQKENGNEYPDLLSRLKAELDSNNILNRHILNL